MPWLACSSCTTTGTLFVLAFGLKSDPKIRQHATALHGDLSLNPALVNAAQLIKLGVCASDRAVKALNTSRTIICAHEFPVQARSLQTIPLFSIITMPVPWERLIRFVADDGRILRGEPILPHDGFDIGDTTEETKLKAKVIIGSDIYDTSGSLQVTDDIVVVKKLLGPLTPEDVPILRCVGLNYATHS